MLLIGDMGRYRIVLEVLNNSGVDITTDVVGTEYCFTCL